MRASLLLVPTLLLAGCLGATEDGTPITAASANNSTSDDDRPVAGICVIGVDSPCNGPEWRDPKLGPKPVADPCAPMIFGIVVETAGPHDAGTPVTLSLLPVYAAGMDGAFPQPMTCPVTWDFGDGVVETGTTVVTRAWETPGLYEVAATLSGNTARLSIGIRLNETFEGTRAIGTGLSCFQDGVDCSEHGIALPEGARVLEVAIATSSATSSCNVFVFGPDGTRAGVGAQVSVESPAGGDWILGASCLGANVPYVITAIGVFEVSG